MHTYVRTYIHMYSYACIHEYAHTLMCWTRICLYVSFQLNNYVYCERVRAMHVELLRSMRTRNDNCYLYTPLPVSRAHAHRYNMLRLCDAFAQATSHAGPRSFPFPPTMVLPAYRWCGAWCEAADTAERWRLRALAAEAHLRRCHEVMEASGLGAAAGDAVAGHAAGETVEDEAAGGDFEVDAGVEVASGGDFEVEAAGGAVELASGGDLEEEAAGGAVELASGGDLEAEAAGGGGDTVYELAGGGVEELAGGHAEGENVTEMEGEGEAMAYEEDMVGTEEGEGGEWTDNGSWWDPVDTAAAEPEEVVGMTGPHLSSFEVQARSAAAAKALRRAQREEDTAVAVDAVAAKSRPDSWYAYGMLPTSSTSPTPPPPPPPPMRAQQPQEPPPPFIVHGVAQPPEPKMKRTRGDRGGVQTRQAQSAHWLLKGDVDKARGALLKSRKLNPDHVHHHRTWD
jgi:hypothetical protein